MTWPMLAILILALMFIFMGPLVFLKAIGGFIIFGIGMMIIMFIFYCAVYGKPEEKHDEKS